MNLNDIINKNLQEYYSFIKGTYEIDEFGTGLINHTWVVTEHNSRKRYIFQRVNDSVFKKPEDIAHNIKVVNRYLKDNYPDYLFEAPILTKKGKQILKTEEGYFRLFRFVPGSHTIDVVESLPQAFEAARQFGLLTANLDGFDTSTLKFTLPDFHNLPLRFKQFQNAVIYGNQERIKKTAKEIRFLFDNRAIAEKADRLVQLPVRVIHHDTKISNVLFNDNNEGLCVIDLDTLMPGRFVSDLGDMMRTYLSPVSEEEADFDKVDVRADFFKAILEGYLSAMKPILTSTEKEFLIYSGQFMIYMQALRFITDYLNDDAYYGARYEDHNFFRGGNQIVLLAKYQDKISNFQTIVDHCV